MSQSTSPSIVTSGLVFYYDMNNKRKSWLGAPTTNLNSGAIIYTYLNTPSDVTSVLTQTTELYRGQPVYKQVLTPITATGVNYLTNLGNPGIGIYTSGGGGAAARYTGHSIYFKPALGRSSLHPSAPIYTHYSNIGGWQSSSNYDDMGDGWYRGHVIFYSSGGGSDGKYWAINPAGATLNVPITIYWAAPFKEDRNDSTFVSPYVYDSRSNTQAIVDLTNTNTLTVNSLTYASDGTFSFNGSSNYTTFTPTTAFNLYCLDFWMYNNNAVPNNDGAIGGPSTYQSPINFNSVVTYGINLGGWTGGATNEAFHIWSATAGGLMTYNQVSAAVGWHHVVFNWNGTTYDIWLDGVKTPTYAHASGHAKLANITSLRIGSDVSSGYYFNGNLSSVKCYNVNLTDASVLQNFNALRGRYGL